MSSELKFLPWLTLQSSHDGSLLLENPGALEVHETCELASLFTTFVGRRMKSLILQQLLDPSDRICLKDAHGQTFLWNSSRSSSRCPLFLDCEFHSTARGSVPPLAAVQPMISRTLSRNRSARSGAGHDLVRMLSPLSDVVCLFASDLAGFKGVADIVSIQLQSPSVSDLPPRTLPSLLVVVESSAAVFDCHEAENKLLGFIAANLDPNAADPRNAIEQHFRRVQVIGVSSTAGPKAQAEVIRKRICSLRRDSSVARKAAGFAFCATHFRSLTTKALDQFATAPAESFSFALATRSKGFSTAHLASNLQEFFSLIPSEAWSFHVVCPLLASCIIFASYPPGSHMFPIAWLYAQLFKNDVDAAAGNFFVHNSSRESFQCNLLRYLDDYSRELTSGTSAALLHSQNLNHLGSYLVEIKTNNACLCCMLEKCSKVLDCGHAICNGCIRILGQESPTAKHAFLLHSCPFCGGDNQRASFQMMPPTAGVRALSLDGGGIKGIIPLVILRALDKELASFRAPICEYFDFVAGTSAGGLIAIGLFLMGWSLEECMTKFEAIALKTFPPTQDFSPLQRLRNLVIALIRDWKHSSAAIEEAFKSSTNTDVKLFNPLVNDTKVAITTSTTTASKPEPCIFSNYNYSADSLPDQRSSAYTVVRADDTSCGISLAQAATCTSAAPLFFKPVILENYGTFQDGGLRHNNPVRICKWEIARLWPDAVLPDFALSIGTGKTASTFQIGCSTPHKKTFSRIYDSFMEGMDGERIWTEFFHSLSDNEKERYHRINVFLQRPEPLLDDILSLQTLKETTTIALGKGVQLHSMVDAAIASMFYLELDRIPEWNGVCWSCDCSIFCRMPLPPRGRLALYDRLRRTDSFFLVFGDPVVCVEHTLKGAPQYRRRVRFILPSLDDEIRITLSGITSRNTRISGIPRTARTLMQLQDLSAPFGKSDHSVVEKSLPKLPNKRKRSS